VTPLVLAHRGACWAAPENTIEAFELAIVEGADYIEFDVRARGDELVICHDPGPPEGLPRLEEVLANFTGRIGLAVEIKETETTTAILSALERHGARAEETMVVSFQREALELVTAARADFRCVFHIRALAPTSAIGFWGVGLEEPAEAGVIGEAQSLGLATTVFTVNEPERIAELAALGVTGIFTDRPRLARETLRAAR
jgi:glycerophosphoryl diester phosphodiesterase